MLLVDVMGATPRFIFFLVAVVLFILSGIGFKPAGDRVHLVGLGLAAFVFPFMWDALALT
jgi:hypothetical protein